MTVSVRVHVNGKYKATVKHNGHEFEVHGNYEGSPNPSGGHSFSPGDGTFEVSEKQVVDEAAKGDE